MRDPNRLDSFYAEKCRLHKKYLPDFRVGQFDSLLYGYIMQKYKVDLFFPEEDRMLEYLKDFIKHIVGDKYEE